MILHAHRFGSGPPLMVLHGLFGSGSNWAAVGKALAGDFETVALDQRNHGRSFHNDRHDYPAMAGDLLAFMDTHDIARAAVLGHSMGGKTAVEFALTHPRRVERLILVDVAPRDYPCSLKLPLAMQAVDLHGLRRRTDAENALAPVIRSRRVRAFLLRNLARDQDGWRWRINLPAITANYEVIYGAPPAGGTYSGPTLVIRGGKSDYVTPEDLGAIRQHFPIATVRTVHDAGHWVHTDAPEEFLRVALAFLCKPPAAGQ